MSQNGLKILLGLALIAVVAAWYLSQREQAQFGLADSQALAAELAADLGSIDSLQLTPAGKTPFSVVQRDGAWVVAERGGYPADTQTLRRELRKIADATKLEPKTALEKYYAQLGVEDIDKAKDPSLRITAAAGDQVKLDLLIGQSGSSGSYVREVGEAQSWLADTRLTPPREITSWLDRELVDISRTAVQQIAVTPADGKAYQLSKSDAEQQDFQLTPAPPAGRDLNFANLNRLGAALARLRLKDVVTQLPEELAWNETVFRQFDGLTITARSAKHGEERLLQLRASVETPVPAADEASEVGDAPTATPATDPATLAEQINARVGGWTYSVSSYNGDALSLNYEFMLKELTDDSES